VTIIVLALMILATKKPDVQIFQRIVTITIIVLLIVVILPLDAEMRKFLLVGVLTTVLVLSINVTQKRALVLMNIFHVMIRMSVLLMVVTQSSVVPTTESLATITQSVPMIAVNLTLVAKILR
jgi:hypothetical protein